MGNLPADRKQVIRDEVFESDLHAAKEDEFLQAEDLLQFKLEAVERAQTRILSEIEASIVEKKWEDAIALWYPVNEKLPELTAKGLDVPVRAKMAFVLGQVKRFDEAIKELDICIEVQPEIFLHHHSLAYTAYSSLWAAKNREIFLAGKERNNRIQKAHTHFQAARAIRPNGVTNAYREGMLYKEIESKTKKSLPLFLKAIKNWESLESDEKEARHQERKNYIKSLYQAASVLLKEGNAGKALAVIQRCLKEDEASNHIGLVFKYFALGKVQYHLNRYAEARDALLFAVQCGSGQPIDFVNELLARTYLAMDSCEKAQDSLGKIPEKRRRPYICWTESDILLAKGEYARAADVLKRSAQHDRRSKHKSLIRLAKIEYFLKNFQKTRLCAEEALRFYRENWDNVYTDALFWQALGAYRSGASDVARRAADELKDANPQYPKLNVLIAKLNTVD